MFLSLRRFIGNKLQSLLPSSCFRYRRFILKCMGVSISKTANPNIGIQIYGPGKIIIGENTWIGPNCHFYTSDIGGNIEIGDNCDIAPEVTFITGSHKIGKAERRAGEGIGHNLKVDDGSWICAKSTILCGFIGKSCVVGAGAIVLDDVPDNVLIAGNPARIRKVY